MKMEPSESEPAEPEPERRGHSLCPSSSGGLRGMLNGYCSMSRVQVSLADCLQGFAKLVRHCDFELYEAYSGAGTAGITLKQVVREMTAVVRAASPEVPWPLPLPRVKTVSACDHNPNCRVFLTSLHEDSRAARVLFWWKLSNLLTLWKPLTPLKLCARTCNLGRCPCCLFGLLWHIF